MADAKWAADERRLQPAFSDWSAGRYKSVDAQLRQHLKKHPGSQPALVLRLLLLQKQQAPVSDLLSAYREVKNTGDLSARSLWGCTLALRNMGRQDMILELHQEMWERVPSSVELGEQVVLSAAGAWDTAVLKTASRRMFNMTKNATWARVAAWAEFITNVEDTPSGLNFPRPPADPASLKPAQLLMHMSGKASETSDHLWLRLQILVAASDMDGFRKVFDQEQQHPTGNITRWWWRGAAMRVVLERSPDAELARTEFEAVSNYLKADELAQRNYAFYQYLLFLAKQAGLDAKPLLMELHEQIGSKERAPLLAMLDLTDEKSALIEEYWAKWRSTGPTLREVWDLLEDDLSSQLSSNRKSKSHNDELSYSSVANEHILHLLTLPTDWRPTNSDIRELWTLYEEGYKYGCRQPRNDVLISDRIGLAATQLLVTQFHLEGSELSLLRAVVALILILHRSPSCAHARFALVRLCRTIGAPSFAATHLSDLRLNEIQLDTMLHVFIDRGAIDAHLGQADAVLNMYGDRARQMRNKSMAELPEHVKQALENESYSKINSLRTLLRRIDKSITNKVFLIECTRSALLKGMVVKDLEPLWELVAQRDQVDNRDWELMPDIGGHRVPVKKMTEMGEPVDEDWVGHWAFGLATVVSFLKGEEHKTVAPPPSGHLLPAEGAFLRSTTLLMSHVRECVAEGDGTGVTQPFPELFDGLIQHAREAHASRGRVLYQGGLLGEFLNIFKLVSKRVDELAKAPSKKRKAPARIVELSRALKAAQEDVKPKIQRVADMLLVLLMQDDDIPVDAMATLVSESQRLEAIDLWIQLSGARAAAIRNLLLLLGVKKGKVV